MSGGRFIKTYGYLQTTPVAPMLPTLVGVEVWRDEKEEFTAHVAVYQGGRGISLGDTEERAVSNARQLVGQLQQFIDESTAKWPALDRGRLAEGTAQFTVCADCRSTFYELSADGLCNACVLVGGIRSPYS